MNFYENVEVGPPTKSNRGGPNETVTPLQRTTGEYTTQERCQTDAYVLVASVAKSEPSSAIFSLIFQLVLLHILLALEQRTKSVSSGVAIQVKVSGKYIFFSVCDFSVL